MIKLPLTMREADLLIHALDIQSEVCELDKSDEKTAKELRDVIYNLIVKEN